MLLVEVDHEIAIRPSVANESGLRFASSSHSIRGF